ncbi:MAG: tRNA lysidine(34) synthetase TilS [Paludibacter sp.]|nr:tRNA lysidine(34) synthetase TilS [Paludibacter sp.]
MLQKIAAFIDKNNLLQRSGTVIVALSGGADSVSLLDILIKLQYKCVAAHCNFQLRAEESQRDEQFVRQLCSRKDITLFVKKFETEQFSRAKNISIEMAARELRYRWFEQLLVQTNAQAIAVAHHNDDNIETFLLNIIRGTGLKGLCGISARNGNVVRPLLNISRTDIENYVKVNRLDFVTDSTNFENNFKRNKIRNEVLPLMQTLNPSVRNTILEEINIFKGIYKTYENAVENIKNQTVEIENNTVKIHIDKLLEQKNPTDILFEIVKNYGFNFTQTENIIAAVSSTSGKTFYSEKHKLITDRKFIFIKEKELNKDENKYLIHSDCEEIINPIYLKFKKYIKENDFIVIKNKNTIQIDYDKITFPLELRKWKTGDCFYPFGMKTRQKLSDFFINNKLSVLDKNDVWLLVCGEKIVWIVGLRADNRFRIDKKTQKILEISLL